jgi:Leucine-rich repeat (LRR) protein
MLNLKQFWGQNKKKIDKKIDKGRKISFETASEYTKYINMGNGKIEILPAFDPLKYSSLVRLNLSENRLKTLPRDIFGLPSLKYLDVSNNHLESLPGNTDSISIKQINGKYVSICDTRPKFDGLIDMPLETLNVTNNYLSHIPLWYFNIRNIRYIYANGNFPSVVAPSDKRPIIIFTNTPSNDTGFITSRSNKIKQHNVNGTLIEYIDSDDEDNKNNVYDNGYDNEYDNEYVDGQYVDGYNYINKTNNKLGNNRINNTLSAYVVYLQNENIMLSNKLKHQDNIISLLLKQKNNYAKKLFTASSFK